jgi:hypothetical protein
MEVVDVIPMEMQLFVQLFLSFVDVKKKEKKELFDKTYPCIQKQGKDHDHFRPLIH